MVAADDTSKPLRSRLLAVPALRSRLLAVPALRRRYLAILREMADRWLDWSRLGPIATDYHDLIDADVAADTRKLYSYRAFQASLAASPDAATGHRASRFMGLRQFAEQRRRFLLERLP